MSIANIVVYSLIGLIFATNALVIGWIAFSVLRRMMRKKPIAKETTTTMLRRSRRATSIHAVLRMQDPDSRAKPNE